MDFQTIIVSGTLFRKSKLKTTYGYACDGTVVTKEIKNNEINYTYFRIFAKSNNAIELSHVEVGEKVIMQLEYQTKKVDEKYFSNFLVRNIQKLAEVDTEFLEYVKRQKENAICFDDANDNGELL